jgi:hypothetical protein
MRHLAVLTFVYCLTLTGCGSDNPAPLPEPTPVLPPEASTLIFPDNLSECTEGELLSNTQSRIQFQWSAGANSDSFTLEVVDLSTNTKNSVNTQNSDASLTLIRGNSYSWSVISRNSGTTETARSTTWYFYNAGIPVDNYAPFPAELTAPVSGSVKNAGPITLYWKGMDLDDENLSYEIFLSDSNPPESSIGITSNVNFTTVLSATGTYYWRIRSTDITGNSALSEVSEFRIE